jgi:4-hydroxy-4-methyl-2-oxoglutarate aldolase
MDDALSPRHVVITAINRADESGCAELRTAGTATVHEAAGRRGFVGADIRPIQIGASICGPAVTVRCHPGDNLMIHAAIEWCAPGDVLVVTNTAPSTHGMFGDLLATAVMARGVVGLVIDAGVRDTAALREMRFPVWSRHVSCEGTVKASPGSVNVPVVIGNAIIHPGDAICADDDGVVVVDRHDLVGTLAATRRRISAESATRARLLAGEPSIEVFGLRSAVAAAGVVYVGDGPRHSASDTPGAR